MPLTDEIEIEMEGEWETNSHGTQYKVETFLEVVPRTREGILGYLSCGSLKGIGPKTAERIVNRFGLDTLEVMEKYPQELLKIQGISQKNWIVLWILLEKQSIPGIDDFFITVSCYA